LSFIPSFLLLGVTRHVSTDVAAFPLLWIVPLAIYLGSFVASFRGEGRAFPVASRALRLVIIPSVITATGAASRVLAVAVSIPLLVFALAAYVAHRRLYDGRPGVDGLTRFYLLLSVGGLLGGIGGALLAPVVFDSILEYPIGLILAATLLVRQPSSLRPSTRLPAMVFFVSALGLGALAGTDLSRLLLFGMAGVVAYAWSWRSWVFTTALVLIAIAVAQPGAGSKVLAAERTFYGVYQVRELSDVHVLLSGTTIHGAQVWEGDQAGPAAIGYYDAAGPVGHVLAHYADRSEPVDVGVVGLGAGTLAAYVDEGDSMTFYEIDEAVVGFAKDPNLFTYLSSSHGSIEVVLGDGRLELERLAPKHDVLVIDAFSSDSIPIHLMTLEAVALYLDSVKADGIVVFHISNRHLTLAPVVGRIGVELGLAGRVAAFQPSAEDTFASPSIWVVMGQSEAAVGAATDHPMWAGIAGDGPLWTDDYSNVVSVIRWK
jgi:spermidine synthase